MTDNELIYEALLFIRALMRSYSGTSIDFNTDDLRTERDIAKRICTRDNIKRADFVGKQEAEIYKLVNYYADHEVKDVNLRTEIHFVQNLIDEMLEIITRVTKPDDDSISLNNLKKGLRTIRESISFGNPSMPEESGLGYVLTLMDLVTNREVWHQIYRAYTNSSPLAKYYVIIKCLDRRVPCQILTPM